MIKNVISVFFMLTLSVLAYGEETAATVTAATVTQPSVTEAEAVTEAPKAVAATETVATAETETVATAETAKHTETAKLAEDQIPLAITADKKTADAGSTTTKAMASGVIVVILLAVSYYYVRRYKTSNTINKSNMQIKVLTQHYLGPKKSLAIIHVAGESILVGITDTNISMIKSLSLIDDEVPAEMPKTFSETIAKSETSAQTMVDELDEEFSFAGVTDTVSKKIKSMRSFS